MRIVPCTTALFVAAAFTLGAASAHAQVPDSVIAASWSGRSLFRVNVDGGTTLGGEYGAGAVPMEGSGTRLMWYPRKAAFRAGYINGTQWDDANIGNSSVAMGESVRASGDNAVAMGLRTVAANQSSFAVGEDNVASGYASVAMGYHASTNARRGSFVFGDNVSGGTGDTVRAELAGQAVWRLSCGMRIYTNQARTTGVSFGGPSVNPSVCGLGNAYHGQLNAMISTSTGAYLSTSGVWTNTSDVNRKHLFETVHGEEVLARLRSLPIGSWSYRVDDASVRHLGPTAQDFRASFGLGTDELTIGTVDADGVALAAAQALERRTTSQGQEMNRLRTETAELREESQALRAEIAALKASRVEAERRLARLEAALKQ